MIKIMNKLMISVLAILIVVASTLLSAPSLAASGMTINLSQTSGSAGSSVTISGKAGADQWVTMKAIDKDGNLVYFSGIRCNNSGDYSDSWIVPDVQSGTLQITVGHGSDVVAASFVVNDNGTSNPSTSGGNGSSGNASGESNVVVVDTEGHSISGTLTETENSVKVEINRGDFNNLAGGSSGELSIDLKIATVTFSSHAVDSLSGSSDAGDISLTIERVDSSSLPAGAQERVGNRPVFDFTLMAGNMQISNFGGSANISVPYTLQAGENPRAVVMYYVDDSGKLRTVLGKYNAKTGMVDFTVRHFSFYAVGYNEVNFDDVSSSNWYYDAVTFCAAREITTGMGKNLFKADDTSTRAQFLVMLMRAYGIEADEKPTNNFADAGNCYYTSYLASAKRLGISNGVGNNLFAPEEKITRQEMATMLYNALKVLDTLPEAVSEREMTDFSDADSVASWAQEAMKVLVEGGTINGSGEKLSPTKVATRGELVQVVYNLLGN